MPADHRQCLDRNQGGQADLAALRAGHGCSRPRDILAHHPARGIARYLHRLADRIVERLANPDRRGDADGGQPWPRLDDFRRAGIPQHRHHAGDDCRHRRHRHRTRVAVRATRARHRRSLGNDEPMRSAKRTAWTGFWRGLAGCALVLVTWELFAGSGLFSQILTPPLEVLFHTTVAMLGDGTLAMHSAATLARVSIGLVLSFAISIPIGLLMGRYALAERFFGPLLSILMPIPSLVWVPLFILWFGIGNFPAILVVVYAASFPLIYNVWSGVRAANPIWIRAAAVMGASRTQLFRSVIWPAALPYVISGSRLAFSRAWIAIIGGELLASPEWGLGRLIFDAKEFLHADVMLSGIFVIGLFGLAFERIVF